MLFLSPLFGKKQNGDFQIWIPDWKYNELETTFMFKENGFHFRGDSRKIIVISPFPQSNFFSMKKFALNSNPFSLLTFSWWETQLNLEFLILEWSYVILKQTLLYIVGDNLIFQLGYFNSYFIINCILVVLTYIYYFDFSLKKRIQIEMT